MRRNVKIYGGNKALFIKPQVADGAVSLPASPMPSSPSCRGASPRRSGGGGELREGAVSVADFRTGEVSRLTLVVVYIIAPNVVCTCCDVWWLLRVHVGV